MADKLPTLWQPGFLRRYLGENGVPVAPPEGKEWKDLKPIEAVKHALVAARDARTPAGKFVVIKAETASGKSTLIPPAAWKIVMERPGAPGVVCGQPRRLTAMEIAKDVGGYKTDGLILGQTLGWLTGTSANTPVRATALTYATTDAVAAALSGADGFAAFARRWSYVFIDEAHERTLSLDLLLSKLRALVTEHAAEPWCPVVAVMSATIDPDQYSAYLAGAPIVDVAGRTFPIAERWPEDGAGKARAKAMTEGGMNFVDTAVSAVVAFHARAPPTAAKTKGGKEAPEDILVFLPGQQEHASVAERLQKEAQKLAAKGQPGFRVFSITGPDVATQGAGYRALYEPLPPLPSDGRAGAEVRRVILATAVAETGLTVHTLRAVVDSGWARTPLYLPVVDAQGLGTQPASRRIIRQRMGRAGRVAPGEFFPLYTQAVFDEVPEAPAPEVLNSDAGASILAILASHDADVDVTGDMGLLEALPSAYVHVGLEKLFNLGLAEPCVAGGSRAVGGGRSVGGKVEPGLVLLQCFIAVEFLKFVGFKHRGDDVIVGLTGKPASWSKRCLRGVPDDAVVALAKDRVGEIKAFHRWGFREIERVIAPTFDVWVLMRRPQKTRGGGEGTDGTDGKEGTEGTDGTGSGVLWRATELGRIAARTAAPPELFVAAASAQRWGACPVDIVSAAAVAGTRGMHGPKGALETAVWDEVLPGVGRNPADITRAVMMDGNAEAAMLLAAFGESCTTTAAGVEWARVRGMDPSPLFEAQRAMFALADTLAREGVPLRTEVEGVDAAAADEAGWRRGMPLRAAAKAGQKAFVKALVAFKRALEAGYRMSTARLHDGTAYKTTRGLVARAELPRVLKRLPREIVYMQADVVDTPKGYQGFLTGVSGLDWYARGNPTTTPEGPDETHWYMRGLLRRAAGDEYALPAADLVVADGWLGGTVGGEE